MSRRVATAACWLILTCAVLCVMALVAERLAYGDWEPPPPPKPSRVSASEGFPPLPLPVTPLRRTEKKRPPAPPALIAKIRYGKPVWKTTEDGRRFSYLDWQSDTTDLHNILQTAGSKLGVKYRSVELGLEEFSFSPSEVPILYISGHHNFDFGDELTEKLRWYLRDGGTLVGDACCGAQPFTESFKALCQKLFPQRPLRQLPADHPIYQAFYQIENFTYQEPNKGPYTGAANIYGIHLGCRVAVLLAPYDVSCGWAQHEHPWGFRVKAVPAQQFGVNLTSYCLATHELGRFLGAEKVYYQTGEPTREEFVFGQVIHGGDWDPHPSGNMALLKYVGANSTMEVQFKRVNVDLRKTEAFQHPLLYMTGHDDFVLLDEEVAALRSYLRNGGILLADACCGRKDFDKAFRRELARVLPNHSLDQVPPSHPLLSVQAKIGKVSYSGIVKQQQPDLNAPVLEGVTLGGVLAVIYSPYGLGTQWDGMERPFARCYSSPDALRIGMNAIVYSMTH
ncbi:MAG TPA: DUF4159 domain-containing protein [Planctomycetota bacterium]|nr:DUF4159 domain-containing protein [Planctomycetota bacterium]HRR81426.1 DUF4159 domain-containing protein [Planctomycetota bacterium]HRT95209.1 DUF4159 domain-containing protein [Planctomycetota bacterium]